MGDRCALLPSNVVLLGWSKHFDVGELQEQPNNLLRTLNVARTIVCKMCIRCHDIDMAGQHFMVWRVAPPWTQCKVSIPSKGPDRAHRIREGHLLCHPSLGEVTEYAQPQELNGFTQPLRSFRQRLVISEASEQSLSTIVPDSSTREVRIFSGAPIPSASVVASSIHDWLEVRRFGFSVQGMCYGDATPCVVANFRT